MYMCVCICMYIYIYIYICIYSYIVCTEARDDGSRPDRQRGSEPRLARQRRLALVHLAVGQNTMCYIIIYYEIL